MSEFKPVSQSKSKSLNEFSACGIQHLWVRYTEWKSSLSVKKKTRGSSLSGGHCTWIRFISHVEFSANGKKYSFFISSYAHISIHFGCLCGSFCCAYTVRAWNGECAFSFLLSLAHTHAHRIYTVYFANFLWTNEHVMCTVYSEHCTCNATRLNVDCLKMAVFICQMSMRFCIKILINQCPLYHDKLKIHNYYTITIINFVFHFLIVNLFYIKIFKYKPFALFCFEPNNFLMDSQEKCFYFYGINLFDSWFWKRWLPPVSFCLVYNVLLDKGWWTWKRKEGKNSTRLRKNMEKVWFSLLLKRNC